MFFLNKEGKYVENVSVLHKRMDRTAVTGARSRYFIWYFVFFIVEKSGNFQGTMLMMIHEVIGWIAIYPSQMIYPCEGLNCLGINPPLTLITCSNSCSADSSLSAHLKDVLTDEFSDINGRVHTRGRTNRLVWQIVSDEQIIVWWANGTNKFFDEQTVWYLAVWKDDFSKTISCRDGQVDDSTT